ncbi:flagellar biosynthesis repressor FlbT [Paracoccus aurantiacus]|uniref:Flagellar biosynthesis repressor FlbT n=1 Tax=Paracoccus aurantiacus TaxID=2599412 RepID=A0A5C6S5K3_9RHOB|nr:flagellar biosynthesis repressor FlbT [Paracoccus aurantiacus]TXB69709.1 flagellar biosynthesis repressor FlbT [Paracoccus aurantiacus]
MSGLVLKLAPNERILINGAVIENGDRRTRIAVKSAHANILRLRDAIHPDDANTPVQRICYQAQLILSGDRPEEEGKQILLRGIEQLNQVFDDRDSRNLLTEATSSVVGGNYYRALRSLRDLLPREARLIAARS